MALDALRGIGVLHADLHPDNVMFVNRQDQPARIKVINFGQATLASSVQLGAELQPLGYRSVHPAQLLIESFCHSLKQPCCYRSYCFPPFSSLTHIFSSGLLKSSLVSPSLKLSMFGELAASLPSSSWLHTSSQSTLRLKWLVRYLRQMYPTSEDFKQNLA